MSGRVFLGSVLLVFLAAGFVAWANGEGEEQAPRVHSDGKVLAEATLEATEALMRDDGAAARRALDRMEQACRQLAPEEGPSFFDGILTLDRAFHKTLTNSREYSAAGEVDTTFDEFIWVQRTCRQCHALAREAGMLPQKGPLW